VCAFTARNCLLSTIICTKGGNDYRISTLAPTHQCNSIRDNSTSACIGYKITTVQLYFYKPTHWVSSIMRSKTPTSRFIERHECVVSHSCCCRRWYAPHYSRIELWLRDAMMECLCRWGTRDWTRKLFVQLSCKLFISVTVGAYKYNTEKCVISRPKSGSPENFRVYPLNASTLLL